MAVTQVESEENVMRKVKIGKVVLNIGVGRSGEPLERAVRVLNELVDQKPSRRFARQTIRDFGIHKGEPIGVMVTIRGSNAKEVLKRLLNAKGMKLASSSFDERGSCSFGIKEHIEIPGVKYNPEIGIFGMNVSVLLERPGYRVERRRWSPSRVGKDHHVDREDAIQFFRDEFGVEVS